MSTVIRDNFEQKYIEIKSLMEKSIFVSFDLEMSGIYGDRIKRSDMPQERYAKMVSVASKYAIIQIGLTFFLPDISKINNVIAYPFTFYTFPDSGADVILSPSSIDFLRKNNMNFNLWITKGIPFVNDRGEEYLMKKFNISNSTPQDVATTVVSPQPPETKITLSKTSDIEYMDRQMKGLHEMISDENQTGF